ncbi:MAG: hypothetical protein R8G34_12305 [Paracoccaceae bacterium]|nr:hypothetical protein [Paracoccaceae bacterium]
MANSAWSATFDFDIVARIESAFLRPAEDTVKTPVGGMLRARMTYSFPPSQQFGGDYIYAPGLETLSISTDAGFSLVLDNQVTSISSINDNDTFIAQSFVSEDPNGWNMVFEMSATAWLGAIQIYRLFSLKPSTVLLSRLIFLTKPM